MLVENGPVSDVTEPASGEQSPGRRRGPRRAVRQGTERETVAGVSADELPDGWGEAGSGDRSGAEFGSNDERLRRDVPPHW